MQPTYQVPWEKLESACVTLRKEIVGDGDFGRLLPVLFLCGLRFQFSYFVARDSGNTNLRQGGAGHLIDDGLSEACESGLRTLMRFSKSRKLREPMGKDFEKTFVNPEWLCLTLAFLGLYPALHIRVQKWIEHGDRQTNLIRFSFGMGVESLWFSSSNRYVHKLMKQPVCLLDWKGEPCNERVKGVFDSFVWDPDWVLPEV